MLPRPLRGIVGLSKLHRCVSNAPHVHEPTFELPTGSYVEPPDAKIPNDFTFIPNFLSPREQTILLRIALQKLDNSGPRSYQKRRKAYLSSSSTSVKKDDDGDPNSLFLPDSLYEFQEKHYDNVIFGYRERHLSSWSEHPSLEPIINRLHSLLPSGVNIQTHLLHLSSDGYIMPHVDNLQASGSWIAAVSLGGPRILRMEDKKNKHNRFELLLNSGSAYIQTDQVRYSYLHSISQGGGSFKGSPIPQRPRLSIMLRDLPPTDSP